MKNFDSFGVMIDCSRNAVPNVAGLKRFFDILAGMGYNCVMLYTEDTYEVEGEPFFGYKRGRYSVAELVELDRYAASRGIELIPCVQTLAHLNAAFRWREYEKIRDCDDILLIDDARTYELIDRMFASLAKAYTSRKIHIGMDEAHHVGLGRYLDRHGFCNRHELLLRHLNKVCEIARSYGFEPMMWEDMFFQLAHGSYYAHRDRVLDFPAEVTEKVPADVSMVYWDYYAESADAYDNMLKSSKNLSDKVWFAGGAWTWGGFAPHSRLSIRRNALAIPACIANGVRNVFFTMWGDDGGECPYFSVLPALMHAAAVAEGLSEAEMKEKFRAVTGEDYDAFLELDLPNHVYGEETMVGTANFSKNRLYDDPFLGIVSVNDVHDGNPHVDGSIFADYAARLHRRAGESASFGFLFETMAALCDALTVKFTLAERTRALYTAGDKAGLRKLAEADYPAFSARLAAFYAALRTQWYAVNKTYGFEVQDSRLGGLMLRMKSCQERLLDFCDGKIDRIEELEDGVLDNDGGNVPSWRHVVTANVVAHL